MLDWIYTILENQLPLLYRNIYLLEFQLLLT